MQGYSITFEEPQIPMVKNLELCAVDGWLEQIGLFKNYSMIGVIMK